MQTIHHSFFSYPITKPYPQRWFTPIVLLGGLVLTVLFSLVNFAPNGYYFRTTYVRDPNTTAAESRNKWYFRLPFSQDAAEDIKCESQSVSVGDKFFTTNLGFLYEVIGISQLDSVEGATVSLPSVLYHNNTLEDCHTLGIEINLLKEGSATPAFWWISWRNSFASATVQCSIVSESGPSNITLQVKYYRPNNRKTALALINNNHTSHASAWWGSSLILSAWYGVMTSIGDIVDDSDNPCVSALLSYYWNDTRSPMKSIRDPDLFDLSFSFITSGSQISNDLNYGLGADMLWTLFNNKTIGFSPALTEGLYFAKVIHSLFIVDLGNAQLSSNLLDGKELEYALSGSDDMNRLPGGTLYERWIGYPGQSDFANIPSPINSSQLIPINESYSIIMPLMGPLGTKPATIFTQYICSLPERKSTGSLLLAILVADLVFLQTAWHIWSWCIQAITEKQDPTATVCVGCLSNRVADTFEPKVEEEHDLERDERVNVQ